MAVLSFKGKTFVQNHHLAVKYHQLIPKKDRSWTDKVSLSDNLIIHGDNLKALKALLPTYAGKVKCIYIDPPYNTGNERWVYNDNVNSPMMQEWLGKVVDREDLTRHDKWLCMMMPRLKLLRDLLGEDGVIFVSIDDNEVHHLRMLMDEVFQPRNFLAQIAWQGMDTIKNDARYFSTNCEFIIVYAKNIEGVELKGIKKGERQRVTYKNYDDDPRGDYLLTPLHAKSGTEDGIYEFIFPNGQAWKPPRGTYPRFSKETLQRLVEESRIYLDPRGRKVPQKKTYWNEIDERMPPWTFWRYEDFGSTRQANRELMEILGRGEFENPKPSKMVKLIVDVVTDKDSIILDSFAGSGTTAHAVLALSKEDGGNRKFILVECEDYADEITAERVRRVMRGVPDAKDERLREGLGGTFSYFELGDPIEMESILEGNRLPSYLDLARYVFYTATGEEFLPEQVDEERHFIGESKDYEVYMLYKPDMEYLRSTALTLDRAKNLGPYRGKKRLVFAPSKYLDADYLLEYRIDYCQLPFEIYRLKE